MNLKIVSKDHSKIANLSNLSQNLKVNSEIYILKEDKESLLGLVSHSLLVFFSVEFAEFALQNYTKKKIPEAETCIRLTRNWIENPNSVSKEELNAAANAATAAYAAYYAYNAVYYAAKATDYSMASEYSSYAAYAAAGVSGKNKNQELERQGRFILDYFSSNAWLFNL